MKKTNNKAKVIVYSAPKGSGKDEAVQGLEKYLYIERLECKEHLYKLTYTIFNVDPEFFFTIYENRELKELPMKEFSVPVTEGMKVFQYLGYKWYDWISDVYYEDNFGRKRSPENDMYKLSSREALIYVSEIFYKPLFGKDIFGKIRADKYDESFGGVYVDASYGFLEELTPLIEKIGQENTLGIIINREGCDYKGDSRKPLDKNILDNIVEIDNNGTIDELHDKVLDVVLNFIK